MKLTNTIISEFASLIVDNKKDNTPKESKESTVYGRVVGFNEIGGRPRIRLDGSAQDIPIRTTVKVNGPKGNPEDPDYYAGDRVMIRIKNHEALIVSNISTQMTTSEGALDDTKKYLDDNGFIYAEQITGEQGDFHYLSADVLNATFLEVTRLTAESGDFHYLSSEKLVSDTVGANLITSNTGTFHYLTAANLNATYLDVTLANLDTANINRASVNSLFVDGFAIATDATIVNGHITGYLDSVEVNANKITTGTLLVDRLYMRKQAENYSSSETYSKSVYVIYNNKIWQATQEISTPEEWNINHWVEIQDVQSGIPFYYYRMAETIDSHGDVTASVDTATKINPRTITADRLVAHSITTDELNATNITANNSSFMESLTNSLTTNYLFATQAEVQDLVANSVKSKLGELDILNINEELKTQNIHLGEIVFDQPSKPEVMSGNPDYLLGIERETKTISAYDSTALYSEGDYVTHYYSKDNLLDYPYAHTTRTHNGITFTDNGDGSITCNGTATGNARFYYEQASNNWNKLEKGKEYIISIDEPTSSTNIRGLEVALYKENTYVYVVWYVSSTKDKKIVIPSDVDFDRAVAYISIGSGQTVNNLTFKPKIRLATNEDANWYPFIKGVYKCIKPITTAELWDENKWYYLRDAVSGDQYEFDHVRYTNIIPSYVGMIIHSTTLSTLAKVKAIYGNHTTWIQHSGYVLRGATSNVVANSAAKTGGADTHTLSASEMPYHRHSIPALSGSASSTGSAHAHSISNVFNFSGNTGNKAQFSTGWAALAKATQVTDSSGAHSHSVTTTANYTGYSGGTNGTTQAHNNLPNYKSVYIWERTT